MKQGRETAFTAEKALKLAEVGALEFLTADPAERVTWDERFQELTQYKEEHGHTRVPRK
jgi:hypothetical protein